MSSHAAMKLVGRLANANERGQGVRYHALPSGTQEFSHEIALCGAEPGRRSVGWAAGEQVTCSACLKRLAAGAQFMTALQKAERHLARLEKRPLAPDIMQRLRENVARLRAGTA